VLSPCGSLEGVGGDPVDVAQAAVAGFVEQRDSVAVEEGLVASDETEAMGEVLGGVVGLRLAETEAGADSMRYENKPLLLTTNLAFSDWPNIFPGAACTTALIDRVVHHADIIPIEGKSYRLRDAAVQQSERNTHLPTVKDEQDARSLVMNVIHPELRSTDIAKAPALVALAVVDTALDVLRTALVAQHPKLRRAVLPLDPCDTQLRRAQSLVGLSDVLRAVAQEYRDNLLEETRRQDAIPY